ncbi:Glutamate receptor ionotropic, delta-1 [Folsomia candida]|uniref:Glutamate receptor ionotropic, delta-1 n=1 Tax=Folsomia candida TaxID=158441 RepID=A0A226E4Q6_FOLCA|nr:Glutamate receptor ionotropic, delta-1 [Folsomia candida]
MALWPFLFKVFEFCTIQLIQQYSNSSVLKSTEIMMDLAEIDEFAQVNSGLTISSIGNNALGGSHGLSRYSDSCLTKLIVLLNFNDALKSLAKAENLKENPRYVLLLLRMESLNHSTTPINVEAFMRIQTESVYFIANLEINITLSNTTFSLEIHQVCFYCDPFLLKVQQPYSSIRLNLPHSNKWNLRKMIIDSPGFPFVYHFLHPPHECHHLGDKFKGEERFCTILTISQHMNFTPQETQGKSQFGWKIHSAQFTSLLNNKRENEQFSWLANGQIVEPFTFLIVMTVDNFNLASVDEITKPFDISTWTLFCSCVLILSLLFNLLVVANKKSSFDAEIFFVIFGSVLEQSPSVFMTKASTNTNAVRLIVIAWLLMCVVMSGGFKGTFFSFMTKQSTPKVPTTFQDLMATSEFSGVAVDFTFKQDYKSYTFVLDDVVLEYKLATRNVSTTINNNTAGLEFLKKTQLYQKLLQSTTFLGGLSYSKIRAIHELRLQIPKNFTKASTPFSIPKNFAFISTPSGISHFTKVMDGYHHHAYPPRSLIFTPNLENLLMYRTMFVVSRSFFSQQFTKTFEALAESGIRRVWEKYRKVTYSNWDRSLLACYLQHSHLIFRYVAASAPEVVATCAKYFVPKTRNEAIRAAEDVLGGEESRGEKQHPLKVDNFVLVLKIFAVGLSMAGAVFILEVVRYYQKRLNSSTRLEYIS